MDCSLPGSSVHGIFQARILESVAISSSRGSSLPRDLTHVSCVGRRVLYHCATWEVLLCWVLGSVFIILNFSEFTLDMDKSHMELHNKLISPQANYHWVAGELVSTRRLREKKMILVSGQGKPSEGGRIGSGCWVWVLCYTGTAEESSEMRQSKEIFRQIWDLPSRPVQLNHGTLLGGKPEKWNHIVWNKQKVQVMYFSCSSLLREKRKSHHRKWNSGCLKYWLTDIRELMPIISMLGALEEAPG